MSTDDPMPQNAPDAQTDRPESTPSEFVREPRTSSPDGSAPEAATPTYGGSAGPVEGTPSAGGSHPANELRERTPEPDSLEAAVFGVLRTVYDPEIPVDIFELGLIYGVDIDAASKVKITMTLTSPTCPAAQSLPAEVEQKVRGVKGVSDYEFELTWEPTWSPEMMSEAAKLTLGMM